MSLSSFKTASMYADEVDCGRDTSAREGEGCSHVSITI